MSEATGPQAQAPVPAAPQPPAVPQTVPPPVPPQGPPPVPPQGPLPEGFRTPTVWAVPARLPSGPRPERPWLRTALRWSVAAGVFLVVGAVTAVCVMVPARTDLPGLRTPGDHRYSFAPLKLPALPSGAAGPNEQDPADGNLTHAADLRQLLLAAPAGAKPVPGYPGTTGWYSPRTYAAQFLDSGQLLSEFADSGLRHIAATAWTGPDGTRTEIYLLAYRSDTTAAALFSSDGDNVVPLVTSYLSPAADIPFPGVASSNVTVKTQPRTGSDPAGALAFLDCGDVEAVIVMTNPGQVNPVTVTQVVTLQNDLLQG